MSYDSAVAADSPQAWWKLADNSGSSTAADSSGHGWTGTASGVTFGQTGATGGGDTSALFTGATPSTINTSFNPSGYTAITLEAWVNLNGSGGSDSGDRLLSNDHTDSTNLGFQLVPVDNGVSPGNPVAYFGNGTTYNAAPGVAALPSTGWTYIVATWNGTSILMYINAVQVASAPLSGTLGTGGFGTCIAHDPAFGGFDYSGLAAQVAIYSTALSGTRISAHYAAASAAGPSGMLIAGII